MEPWITECNVARVVELATSIRRQTGGSTLTRVILSLCTEVPADHFARGLIVIRR